jgi:acetylornithine/succinyldiaminopimelate/putrescine aminotransferase
VSGLEARRALLEVYAPPEAMMVRGDGPWLFDEEGRRYLDFVSGIGVNALGHNAPEFRDAILAALETGLVHTSNLYRTAPAEALAAELVDATFPGRVFFCNSGAETGEAAFKMLLSAKPIVSFQSRASDNGPRFSIPLSSE